MAVAVWCWEAARVRASASRIAACRAAQRGDGDEAIRLTADAQRHDRIAEDWKAHIPEAQWRDSWAYTTGAVDWKGRPQAPRG